MSEPIDSTLLWWVGGAVWALAAATCGAKRHRLDPWTMYLAGLAALGGAVLGGSAFGMLMHSNSPDPASQGSAVFGALAGAGLVASAVIKLRHEPFLRYADAAVPAIAFGYAIYRVGCFVNGCCFGLPTSLPWGVTFPPGTEAFAAQVDAGWIDSAAAHTLPVHPTQLYSAAVGVVAAVCISRLRGAPPGGRVALGLVAYGAARFVIELFRGDVLPVLGSLGLNHLASVAFVLAGVALWCLKVQPRRRLSHDRDDLPGFTS